MTAQAVGRDAHEMGARRRVQTDWSPCASTKRTADRRTNAVRPSRSTGTAASASTSSGCGPVYFSPAANRRIRTSAAHNRPGSTGLSR